MNRICSFDNDESDEAGKKNNSLNYNQI